jgi:hypothetical protein
MHVSQIAYDRFVVELPPADADYRPLADPETVAEAAAWLWDFGPTPLVAVVGYDDAAPSWLSAWSPRPLGWAPEGAKAGVAIVLNSRPDLERFLSEGAPHEKTVLLWPNRSEAKTFEALRAGGAAWLQTIDAHAQISHAGERFEVSQIEQP